MSPSNRVGWLIDGYCFPDYLEALVAEISAQGHEAKVVGRPEPPWTWDDVGQNFQNTFDAGRCVVTHGDIDLVQRVRELGCWMPGVFAPFSELYCAAYYPHLGQYLLNGEYAMLPLGEMERCRKFLFETFAHDGRIFVRPDSPFKSFTGQLVSRERFEADLEFIGFYNVPPGAIVIVSRPQEIVAEWRFVAAEGTILTGSRYKSGGKFEPDPSVEPAARKLAEEIATGPWQPDPVWIIDICETVEGQFRLLEIGGFSCAGLYKCDLAAVVRGVSAAALRVWSDSSASAKNRAGGMHTDPS
jgi:hypothetical protein